MSKILNCWTSLKYWQFCNQGFQFFLPADLKTPLKLPNTSVKLNFTPSKKCSGLIFSPMNDQCKDLDERSFWLPTCKTAWCMKVVANYVNFKYWFHTKVYRLHLRYLVWLLCINRNKYTQSSFGITFSSRQVFWEGGNILLNSTVTYYHPNLCCVLCLFISQYYFKVIPIFLLQAQEKITDSHFWIF